MSTFRSVKNDIVRSCRHATKSIGQVREWPLVKYARQHVVGRQQLYSQGAALIELPQNLRPGQDYVIRLQVVGRDESQRATGGMSALAEGDSAHIEVRLGHYSNTSPIVQQADVVLPGRDSVAVVTLPMQGFPAQSSGRHERLHIFFMNALCLPLYTRPFAVDIFISPLVRYGQEGRTALHIPC